MESSVPTGCEHQTKAQAQARTGATLATALSCADARCLRGKSPRKIFLALRPNMNLFPRAYGPVIDGYVFPEQPIARIRAGQAAKVTGGRANSDA
jgi:para-nitrobenzyl esterase